MSSTLTTCGLKEENSTGLQYKRNKKNWKGKKQNSCRLKGFDSTSNKNRLKNETKGAIKIIKENLWLFSNPDELIAHCLEDQLTVEDNAVCELEKEVTDSINLKDNYDTYDENMFQDYGDLDDDSVDELDFHWRPVEKKCLQGKNVVSYDVFIKPRNNASLSKTFTKDERGFNMKPSNAIFNKLETYSRKPGKYKIQFRNEYTTARKTILDKSSRIFLQELIKTGRMRKLNGIIWKGSQSLILHGDSDPLRDSNCRFYRNCVIKIFKPTLNESKHLDQYIKDDCRFKDRFREPDSRVTACMWAEKEMLNILCLQKFKIPCPTVIARKKNILVLSFIGVARKPADKLKYAKLSEHHLEQAYRQVIDLMRTMFMNANLVHTDLSEYNILWCYWSCFFVDLAKAVDGSHPLALDFMMRDCERVSSYFERCGLRNVKTKEELFQYVTPYSAEEYKSSVLKRRSLDYLSK